jgi:hypothetical protein
MEMGKHETENLRTGARDLRADLPRGSVNLEQQKEMQNWLSGTAMGGAGVTTDSTQDWCAAARHYVQVAAESMRPAAQLRGKGVDHALRTLFGARS